MEISRPKPSRIYLPNVDLDAYPPQSPTSSTASRRSSTYRSMCSAEQSLGDMLIHVSSPLDPTAIVSQLQICWSLQSHMGNHWGSVVVDLIQLVGTMLGSNTQPELSSVQCQVAESVTEEIRNRLADIRYTLSSRPVKTRTTDGVLDPGPCVFPLFVGCSAIPLPVALNSVDLGPESDRYWICEECCRPTGERYEVHMKRQHVHLPLKSPPPPLGVDDLLECARKCNKAYPAYAMYSMESPLYYTLNKAMREWATVPGAYQKWKGFAYALELELQRLPRFQGIAFRAMDCHVPESPYYEGSVLSFNHPFVASSDCRKAKAFFGTGTGRACAGTLLMIQSRSARLAARYSVYPEEEEVVFLAGTQLQVVRRANPTTIALLEDMLDCSLGDVIVLELREVLLDSWRDLRTLLEPIEAAKNHELLDLIDTLPTRYAPCRGQNKLVSAPMTTLIRRPSDGATGLHLAAAIRDNLLCVQLICLHLESEAFAQLNNQGLTALQIAVELDNDDTAVFLLQKADIASQLTNPQVQKVWRWLSAVGGKELAAHLLKVDKNPVTDGTQPAGIRYTAHPNDSPETLEMIKAARSGDVVAIQKLLAAKADAGLVDHHGWTPLLYAAQAGHDDAVTLLLKAGAELNVRSPEGANALMHASQNGHHEVVATLLRNNMDLHATLSDGWSALMFASAAGHVKCVDLLLAAGARIHSTLTDGWNALILAAHHGHASVAKQLLEAGSDKNITLPDGWTPLLFASASGSAAAVEVLLDAKADVQARLTSGLDSLMVASQNGHSAAVQALLRGGADVKAKVSNGWTALLFAASHGHIDAMKVLIDAGADVHVKLRHGWTALMLTARRGNDKGIQLLLESKADVSTTDNNGWTALMHAAQMGKESSIRTLLNAS